MARLAQSAERKALNLVVVGSSPTVGVSPEELFAPVLEALQVVSDLTRFTNVWP